VRLFVAIELPSEVKQQLALLAGGVPGARWVAAENLHLTLRFIGDADGGLFQDIGEALAEVEAAPFELRLKGVGRFGQRRRVRQLWAGVEAGPGLEQLQRRVEARLSALGLEPERRKFHAHVTLARLKDASVERVGGFLAGHDLFASAPFEVASFALISSHLSRNGASYRVEASYPLRG
jgi:2'-5' RNA ligase